MMISLKALIRSLASYNFSLTSFASHTLSDSAHERFRSYNFLHCDGCFAFLLSFNNTSEIKIYRRSYCLFSFFLEHGPGARFAFFVIFGYALLSFLSFGTLPFFIFAAFDLRQVIVVALCQLFHFLLINIAFTTGKTIH